MKARQMYNWMKAKGCIYSDATIREKIHELGVVKRWEILSANDSRFHNPEELLYDRVHSKFMDYNFREVLFYPSETETSRRWVIAEQANLFQQPQPQVTPTAQVQPEENYFSQNELERLEHTANEYGYATHVLSYSASSRDGVASRIYQSVGVLRDGENDNSPTVGFELETGVDAGTMCSNSEFVRSLDTRLGHFETDASISGVEFDSHVFTWNKLKKCKPLFKKMFQELSESGLRSDDCAGLHIHLGRTAFVNQKAFEKFYYLVNLTELRTFWKIIARRNSSSYAQFSSIERGNLAHLRNSIRTHREAHSRAVNQQHSATYEIRIFRSTLSSDIIWGDIELLLNLVDFCNSDKSYLDKGDIIKGEYCLKMVQVVYGRALSFARQDVSFFSRMTQAQTITAMQNALNAGNLDEAASLLQRYQAQQNDDEDDA